MGDLGYYAVCYDCGREFLCGEEFLSYPPSERVCYECAHKRQQCAKDVSEPYTDDLAPCLPYYDY